MSTPFGAHESRSAYAFFTTPKWMTEVTTGPPNLGGREWGRFLYVSLLLLSF